MNGLPGLFWPGRRGMARRRGREVPTRKEGLRLAARRTWRLIVNELAVDRGDRRILDRVSFQVHAGEAVVLRGPNGTGKTTLIRAIAGLLPAAAGEVELEGRPEDAPVGAYCHYIAHRNALKSDLTVRDNLLFWQNFSGGKAASFDDVAMQADLEDLSDIPVKYLSAGQQRRVALARLLASPKPVWLLDEPTVSLDVEHTQLFAELANEHLSEGGLIVAATHTALGFRGERILHLGTMDGGPEGFGSGQAGIGEAGS